MLVNNKCECVVDKKLITRLEYPNVTWRISSYLFTYLCLPTDSHWTGTSIDITLKLNLTLQNIYSTRMCGLGSILGPTYHLPGNVISAVRSLALPILICSPSMSFLAWPVSDNSRSMEKIKLGHCPPQTRLRNRFLHVVWDVVHSYPRVRFDLLSPLTLKI